MTREWRLQEAATIAARVETLRRNAIRLTDSIQSVDLLDAPAVVDEIVAQLRPVDVGADGDGVGARDRAYPTRCVDAHTS